MSGNAEEPDARHGVEERIVGSDRVLAVLAELGQHPDGITLDELATTLSSPKPTVHRALASLRRAGFADQIGRGRYLLGDEYLRLAFQNYDGRSETARIEPVLKELAERIGETAHYAVLDGKHVVYRSKVDPLQGAVRLTSTIGGRNPAYSTAVGKLLLGFILNSHAELTQWIGSDALERRTPNTCIDSEALWEQIRKSHELLYATDDQENEIGVNCVAVPLYQNRSAVPSGAVSISGLEFRRPLAELVELLPVIRSTIESHLGPGSALAVQ